MKWQDDQKQVATGVTDGTDGRKYSKVFPYEPKPRPIRVEDDDDIQDYKRPWVGLTDDEIDQGLLRSDYAFKTAEAWRAGVVFAMTKLKEKNA